MIKWISKSGVFLQFILFSAFLVVFWIPAFVNPLPAIVSEYDGPLYAMLISWLQSSPILTITVSLALIVLQAFLLFFVFQVNGFLKKSNLFPAVIVLFAYSWNIDFQTIHAIVPASVFLIVALNSIMVMYGHQAAYDKVFIASFSISIASLFYIPIAFFLLFVWFSLITFRISSWREYVISLIGITVPYLYYITWLLLNHSFISGMNQFLDSLVNFVLPARLSMIYALWLAVSTGVLLIAMAIVLNIVSDKLISLRRKTWIFFNFSVVSFFTIVMAGWPMLSANYLFVVPMAFFLAVGLALVKRSFWIEILFLLYFLLFISLRVYFKI